MDSFQWPSAEQRLFEALWTYNRAAASGHAATQQTGDVSTDIPVQGERDINGFDRCRTN